jgi:hypothetical protein
MRICEEISGILRPEQAYSDLISLMTDDYDDDDDDKEPEIMRKYSRFTVKMEAACFSETLVTCHNITRRPRFKSSPT